MLFCCCYKASMSALVFSITAYSNIVVIIIICCCYCYYYYYYYYCFCFIGSCSILHNKRFPKLWFLLGLLSRKYCYYCYRYCYYCCHFMVVIIVIVIVYIGPLFGYPDEAKGIYIIIIQWYYYYHCCYYYWSTKFLPIFSTCSRW